MHLLHTGVAEDPNHWNVLSVLFELLAQPVDHLCRSRKWYDLFAFFRFLFIKGVTELCSDRRHFVNLLFHQFGIQFEDGRFHPTTVIGLEVPRQPPQLFVGLQHSCSFLEFWEFTDAAQLQ
jgi:hypothetical protein